jgi:hypothetical protein
MFGKFYLRDQDRSRGFLPGRSRRFVGLGLDSCFLICVCTGLRRRWFVGGLGSISMSGRALRGSTTECPESANHLTFHRTLYVPRCTPTCSCSNGHTVSARGDGRTARSHPGRWPEGTVGRGGHCFRPVPGPQCPHPGPLPGDFLEDRIIPIRRRRHRWSRGQDRWREEWR